MSYDYPVGAALIFGGSGGIGRGVTEVFADQGCPVAIAYNSKETIARELANAIIAKGGKATIHKADVRDGDQVRNLVTQAISEHGRIHSMVWAAGPVVPQFNIAAWTDEQFRNSIEIEAFGFHHAVRALIPHMREKGGGSFVHLGSAGHDWWPHLDGLSVAPKAVNEALIKGLAKEEGINEIRANSVLVGVIDAGQFKIGQEAGTFDANWEAEVKKMLPVKRWGKPEDIGHAAAFLASNQAGYITGQTISVAGGFGV